MPELLQHALVSLVALGAAVVVARRVFGVVKPVKSERAGCDHCAESEKRVG